MRKIYRYEKLSYAGKAEEIIDFKVKFISDGNISHTIVNVPGENDPEIANSGACNLGLLKNLTKQKTVVVSDIANPIPQEDTIAVEYYINDTLLVRHTNLKTETDKPFIILLIKFSKQ